MTATEGGVMARTRRWAPRLAAIPTWLADRLDLGGNPTGPVIRRVPTTTTTTTTSNGTGSVGDRSGTGPEEGGTDV